VDTAPTYDIVVSTENLPYMGWQCMLFHYSCTRYAGHTPLFMVHGDEDTLDAGYQAIADNGGRIQRAPNFRHAGEIEYAARNKARSLDLAETEASHIVLCDPDIVFLARPAFEPAIAAMSEDQMSFEHVGYLKITKTNRPVLQDICRRAHIEMARLEQNPVNGGMPHIVPAAMRRQLCSAWMTLQELCLERNLAHYGEMMSDVWISEMWGLVLALRQLEIEPVFTSFSMTNEFDPPLPEPGADGPTLIHYCYPAEAFNKLLYNDDQRPVSAVWRATGKPGHTTGAICAQLGEAARFYAITTD